MVRHAALEPLYWAEEGQREDGPAKLRKAASHVLASRVAHLRRHISVASRGQRGMAIGIGIKCVMLLIHHAGVMTDGRNGRWETADGR